MKINLIRYLHSTRGRIREIKTTKDIPAFIPKIKDPRKLPAIRYIRRIVSIFIVIP